MKRRAWMIAMLAGGGAVAGWRWLRGNEENAIRIVIYKRLDYLNLDAAGVAAFARDVVARQEVSKARLRALDVVAPLYNRLSLSGDGPVARLVQHGEERITSAFLLSSDLFVAKDSRSAAETAEATVASGRIVRYLGYYDPFCACNQPFARRVPS